MLLSIVYQDNSLLAIYKPAGLLCHPTGQFQGDTLITRLRHYFGKNVWLVHRLDQSTSGVMVVALDRSVVSNLYRQFERGLVHKKYLALVEGVPDPPEGDISLPLAKASSTIKLQKTILPQGEASHTHYRLLETRRGKSILEIIPRSGRKHQIRVHLSQIGHPLLGDTLYQRSGLPFLWEYYCHRPFPFWKEPIPGHSLHAQTLEIFHPLKKTRLSLHASMPETWQEYFPNCL